MSDRHELAGMVNRGFTVDEFKAYLTAEVAPKMAAWRPRGVVLHNTGLVPHWKPGTTPAEAIQHMRDMSVTWASPPNNWSSGPHLVIDKDGQIVAATPLWMRGTHSPSFNFTHWGIEMVGDYDLEPFPDAQRDAVTSVIKALLRMLGHDINADTFKLHKEDPHTTHKHCPGVNCGDKATWLVRLNTLAPDAHIFDLPHYGAVPAGAGTFIGAREGEVLHAYPDKGGYAEGFGSQFKADGTRVQPGDTLTHDEAVALRDRRIADDWHAIQGIVKVALTDGQAIALLSWCYEFNVAKLITSTLLAKLNAQDYAGAAAEFLKWDKVKDANGNLVESPGILKRRKMELALWNGTDPYALTAKPAQPPKTAPIVVSVAPKATVAPPKPGTAPAAPRAPAMAIPKPGFMAMFITALENLIMAIEAKDKPVAGGPR